MAYEGILYDKIDGNIARITMNRPERRNAQDDLMLEELQEASVEADLDESVLVIILAGAGKDFSAGHYQGVRGEEARGPVIGRAMATRLTGMEQRLKKEQYRDLNLGHCLRNVSKPTIAAVQGNCYGGGWIVAAMCDLIICSDDARFIDPLGKFGLSGSEILFHPYEIGFRRAKELLWTGDAMSAVEAKQVGMVSRVVARDRLEEEALALARRIATNPPVGISLIKRSINHAQDLMGERSAWEYHMLIHQLSHASDEAKKQKERIDQAVARGGAKEAMKTVRDAKYAE